MTDRHRTNFGIYADAETDLRPKVLADVAARFEDYSDFGSRVSGKVARAVPAVARVTLRGAASTGFRAPGLSQDRVQQGGDERDRGRVRRRRHLPRGQSGGPGARRQAAREETSYNLSAGVAVTPVDNLTFTADYFHIRINNRILLGATFDDAAPLGILADAGFGNIEGVQYFTNGLEHADAGRGHHRQLPGPAGGSGTLDLNAPGSTTPRTRSSTWIRCRRC